jgi:hypothetical protein
VVASREEKSNPSVLVAFAMTIPLLLVGLSNQLCTTLGERVKICLPIAEGDTFPATVVPLSSDPLAPAICQDFPVA